MTEDEHREEDILVKNQDLDLKDRDLSLKIADLFLKFLALCIVVAGGCWGFLKFQHQKDIENRDSYRLMSQPYRELELTRLVRIVDSAGTIAARYPGDSEDASYRDAVRAFSNDFFSAPVMFQDARVEHATDDFALGVEHCTGEPVRGMPPKDPHPDGKCAPCIRTLALNLSIAARSQLAREWSQNIDPDLGNESDDCTNWAHQFRPLPK